MLVFVKRDQKCMAQQVRKNTSCRECVIIVRTIESSSVSPTKSFNKQKKKDTQNLLERRSQCQGIQKLQKPFRVIAIPILPKKKVWYENAREFQATSFHVFDNCKIARYSSRAVQEKIFCTPFSINIVHSWRENNYFYGVLKYYETIKSFIIAFLQNRSRELGDEKDVKTIQWFLF